MQTDCSQGKRCYESERQAHVAARKSGARNIRAYLCHCGNWHFTRSVPKTIKHSTPPKGTPPKPYAPGLRKLRAWLEAQQRTIDAQFRRLAAAEAKQKAEQDKARAREAAARAEHNEEIEAIRKMTERLQWR